MTNLITNLRRVYLYVFVCFYIFFVTISLFGKSSYTIVVRVTSDIPKDFYFFLTQGRVKNESIFKLKPSCGPHYPITGTFHPTPQF